jgi:hypothetical protein
MGNQMTPERLAEIEEQHSKRGDVAELIAAIRKRDERIAELEAVLEVVVDVCESTDDYSAAALVKAACALEED